MCLICTGSNFFNVSILYVAYTPIWRCICYFGNLRAKPEVSKIAYALIKRCITDLPITPVWLQCSIESDLCYCVKLCCILEASAGHYSIITIFGVIFVDFMGQ